MATVNNTDALTTWRSAPRRVHRPKPIPDIDRLPASALLTNNQLATLLGLSMQTPKLWRREGRGPKAVTLEGRPRYRVGDVREYLSAQLAAG